MDRHSRQTPKSKYHNQPPKWKGSVDIVACLPIFVDSAYLKTLVCQIWCFPLEVKVYFTWKNLYCQSQYSKTWDSKCMVLIAQMVREFGMNPKVEGSSPPSKSLNHSIIWPRYQWSFDVCKHTAMVKMPRVYICIYIYFLFQIYSYRVNHSVTLCSHDALLQRKYLEIENTYMHIHEYKSYIKATISW